MNTHRIHRVAKLTGLSKDVIRVWERRYGFVKPLRGPNRYRIYTDEDVALLRYVRSEMEKGQSIGDLAEMGREELLSRMRQVAIPSVTAATPYDRLLEELVTALDPLDQVAFERRLNGAVAVIPFEEALVRILLPLQRRVGDLWHEGRISEAVEHYVTKQVQQKLFAVMNHLPLNENGPKVLVGCLPGEEHEIGAQAVAYLCAVRGCRVYYLGPNLPLASLGHLCAQLGPDLVLLSLVGTFPPAEAEELAGELGKEVRKNCPVILGGAGAKVFQEVFAKHQLEVLDDLPSLERRVVTLLAKRSVIR
jgi:MerR family transcriptional regulator, light-induced transcriptional regulator